MKPDSTPWRALLAAASELGIPPPEFWRLSLREWRAVSTSPTRFDALARGEFNSLSAQFPDTLHDHP
ncbi:MAG: phage tail assembly chaperone [Terricaulis sp.]